METEPTIHDAIRHYFGGKLDSITPAQLGVWVDSFRGYNPLTLIEAARIALKQDRGKPSIERLHRRYADVKRKAGGGKGYVEAFTLMDLQPGEYEQMQACMAESIKGGDSYYDAALRWFRDAKRTRWVEASNG